MLTTNVDTTDGLTNGTFGQVFGFEKDNKGKIIGVLVQFLKEKSGKELRKRRPDLERKYRFWVKNVGNVDRGVILVENFDFGSKMAQISLLVQNH